MFAMTQSESWPQAILRGALSRGKEKPPPAAASAAGSAQQAFGAYIDSFRETELLGALLEGLTADCKQLMLRHTTALFGDVKELHANFMVRDCAGTDSLRVAIPRLRVRALVTMSRRRSCFHHDGTGGAWHRVHAAGR
jgi:hypothetical protein